MSEECPACAGRSTQRAKRGQTTANSAGDLSFLDSAGEPFLKCCAVEIKNGYPTATLNKLFTSQKPDLLSFFSQASASANQAGVPHWIVIHKQDRQPVLLYCDAMLLLEYSAVSSPGIAVMLQSLFEYPFRVMVTSEIIDDNETRIAILTFDDFLTLDPTMFRPEILCS